MDSHINNRYLLRSQKSTSQRKVIIVCCTITYFLWACMKIPLSSSFQTFSINSKREQIFIASWLKCLHLMMEYLHSMYSSSFLGGRGVSKIIGFLPPTGEIWLHFCPSLVSIWWVNQQEQTCTLVRALSLPLSRSVCLCVCMCMPSSPQKWNKLLKERIWLWNFRVSTKMKSGCYTHMELRGATGNRKRFDSYQYLEETVLEKRKKINGFVFIYEQWKGRKE